MSHANATTERTRRRPPAPIDRAAVDRAKARLSAILASQPAGVTLSELSRRVPRPGGRREVRDAAVAELAAAGAVEVRQVAPHPQAGGLPATVVCLPGAPEYRPRPPRGIADDAPADPAIVAAVRAESIGAKAGQSQSRGGSKQVKQRFFKAPHPTRWEELSHADASREIRRMFRKRDPRLFAERFAARPGDDHNGPGKHDRGGVLP